MRKFLTTLKSNKYISKKKNDDNVDYEDSERKSEQLNPMKDQMIMFARFPLKGPETTNGDAYDIYTLSAICT